MAYITEQLIRKRFADERQIRHSNTRYFSATDIITEGRQIGDSIKTYDIFLSHSSNDKELIAGLKLLLQDMGYSIYVDWNDPALNPNHVTPQTAEVLRKRMAQCRSLIYAFSENASNSKWMPWELGYFDALKNSRVAVLPIRQDAYKAYSGSEFVGLYHVIQKDNIKGKNEEALWVCDNEKYVFFDSWLNGSNPIKHN